MLPSRAAKAVLVAVVLIAALAIRIAFIETTPYHAINDAGTYNRLGSLVAQTGDYSTGTAPRSGAGGSRGPTAYFPPAYPYFIALVDLIDGHQAGGKTAIQPVRFAQALIGTVTVGLIGLVALEAFGSTVGLVALVIAAIYAVLVELTGTLVSENLMVMFELAAVWTALRARRAAHPYGWIAAAGVLTGLATLTHQNAILIVIPLAFAAYAVAQPRPNRTRPRLRALAAPAILILTTLITILPWTIRNAVELHRFVPVSDEAGITLVGTYNPVSAGQPAGALQVAPVQPPARGSAPDAHRRRLLRAGPGGQAPGPGAQLHQARTRSRRWTSDTTICCGCSSSRAPTRGRRRPRRWDCTSARPGSAWTNSGSSACWR